MGGLGGSLPSYTRNRHPSGAGDCVGTLEKLRLSEVEQLTQSPAAGLCMPIGPGACAASSPRSIPESPGRTRDLGRPVPSSLPLPHTCHPGCLHQSRQRLFPTSSPKPETGSPGPSARLQQAREAQATTVWMKTPRLTEDHSMPVSSVDVRTRLPSVSPASSWVTPRVGPSTANRGAGTSPRV